MKRKIVIFVLIAVCFLLQSTVFQSLAIGSISPNLMIILVSSFGFMGGKNEGMLVGLLCGLLEDIFYGRLLGMHALIYMYIGYGNGYFHQLFYPDDIKLPMGLISGSELIYGLGTYVVMFLLRSRFDFPYYLVHIILPELVYTIIITIGLYQIILRIDQKFEIEDNS